MQKRSTRRRSLRSLTGLVAAALGSFAVLLAFPLTSLADLSLGSTVGGLVNGVTSTVQTTVQNVTSATSSLTGAGAPKTGTATSSAPAGPAPSAPAAASKPASSAASSPTSAPASKPAASSTGYTPPMYGTNPHGQGTVSSVALNPSSSVPYSYAAGGSSSSGEIAVIGRGRSEQQSNGSYDGHTTIVGLLGTELLGVDAQEGQSNSGPLSSVQNGVLTPICTGTNAMVCLTLLAADTSASSNGANTHFTTAGVSSQQLLGLNASAASSDSSISQSGSCQTASGDSSVANVGLDSGPVASVSQSSEGSTACAGQAPSQTASSSVIGLGGTGIGLPAAGCANSTPNTSFTALSPLATIVCNADDPTQASTPAGVREALTVLGLQIGGTTLARATTAASEAHAVAPSSTTTTSGATNGGNSSGNGGSSSASGSGKGNGGGRSKSNGSGSGPPNKSTGNCTDADHNCGIGPNGTPEVCVAGVDPDGDGDCVIGANRFAGQITAAKSPSSLPFTGQNVLEVMLVGLILAGVGLALSLSGNAPRPFRKRS